LDGVQIGRDLRMRDSDFGILITTGNTTINRALTMSGVNGIACSLTDTELGRFRSSTPGESACVLDNVSIGGNFVANGSDNDNFVAMTGPCDIQGNFVFRGKGGLDAVMLEGTIGGDVRVSLGTGPNSIFQVQDLTVLGGVKVTSAGDSVDDWEMVGLNVLGTLVLRSGAGDDEINLESSNVFGAFKLSSGAGLDTVVIARVDDVILRGAVTIRLGDGDDYLELGHGAGGTADFRASVLLDGGAGVNTLDHRCRTQRSLSRSRRPTQRRGRFPPWHRVRCAGAGPP
jgi:hypothetical protein